MPRSLAPIALLLAFNPAIAQEPPRMREVVDVTVANVEVIVTDAEGKRVRGLSRDAFEMLENGKPVRISNFAEIDENVISFESSLAPDAASTPPEVATPRVAPVRRVVVFVDIATVTGIRRKKAIAEISRFLDQLGPDDERMIASWDGVALKVEVPPDAAREGDKTALEQLARRPRTRWSPRVSKTSRLTQTIVTGRRDQLHRSVLAVRALLAQMKPLDGRKVLVLVTAGFPLRPGREIVMGPDLEAQTRAARHSVEPYGAIPVVGLGPTDTHAVKLYDRFAIEAGGMLRALGDAANAAGVTLYPIHGLGASPRVAIGAYNPPETDLVLPGIGVDPVQIAESVGGLSVIAERSGGTVTAKTNDLARAFREIRQDLSSYYSLGYHLSGDRGVERNVEVRMRDPNLTARARTSVVVSSAASEAEDAVVSSLSLPESPWGGGPANELGISAVAGAPKRTSRGRQLAVDVRIPLAALSWEEKGDDLVAPITLFIGAADAERLMTDIQRSEHEVRIPRAALDREGAYYTYVFDVDLRTRTANNDIAVAVVDDGSGLTGHAIVEIGSAKR